ncbi:hypothetical protein ABTZ58_12000 [Streptomyces sp. NPDC094143]|uniref:hypothetical protein n=1 Tax=Streptomyces sp. NPDC094143 TaxID=3155310 RepID=UPI00332EBB33
MIAILALLVTLVTTLLSVLVTGEASADTIAQSVMTAIAAGSGVIVVAENLISRRNAAEGERNNDGPESDL